jgi:hypothetical protein
MAFVGFGLGTVGSLALGSSGSSAIRNGAIIGAVNGLYQGHKKGKTFQWGGGSKRKSNRKRSPKQWVQNAERSIEKKGHRGLFSRKAEMHGLSTTAFACKVLANRDLFDARTVKQANFYRNINKSHRC